MIGIVPSSTAEDIFEVDEFIKKYDNLYGYVGVFPEEVKGFTDKTLSDMENIIKNNPKFLAYEQKKQQHRKAQRKRRVNGVVHCHCAREYSREIKRV
jgi:hypothetical protein